MLRVESLIERCRRETENEEFSDNTGIEDQEFIDYLNDAQKDLQSAIARQHQNVFTAEADYDIIATQEAYTLPKDIYLDNRITNVWYSDSGNTRDLRRLRSGTLTERLFNRSSTPILYIRDSGKLLLSPVPSRSVGNGLKIVYVKKLSDLDIRRAKIASVVLDNTAKTITSLFLDTSSDLQRDELLKDNYICVVDRFGNQTMKSILFDAIDDITGEVTIDSSFVFSEGETLIAGDYITRGFDSVNLSLMPDTCERYLSAYNNWKILKRDSSLDSNEQTQELVQMREEIVGIFAQVDDDVKHITIDDTQFIDDDDLWSGW